MTNKTIIPKLSKALAWKFFSDNNNGETVSCQLCKPRDVKIKDPEKVESCVIVKTNLSLLREMGLKK
jgi:hypothetical protein